MMKKYLKLSVILLLVAFTQSTQADIVAESDKFWDALTGGKPYLVVRYRFEHVDDDGLSSAGVPLRDADASTIRVVLGYETGMFHSFNAGIEFEHISEVGPDDFNNGSNGKTQFATVADPEGSEINQAWIGFSGVTKTKIKIGRQIITYRKAPLHRYLGTVLWRQNWQTHDAATALITPTDHLKINYGYVWAVNRIFGRDARDPLDRFDSNSHLVNIQFDKYPQAKLEGYGYLLDFDNAPGFSTGTVGGRVTGAWPVKEGWKALYGFEYAHQWDRADNPAGIDANYYLVGAGIAWQGPGLVDSASLMVNHEVLGGDGGADRFVTILGTNHAFQGWADRFVVTPGDGIEDTYVNLIGTFAGAKVILSYHMLESDHDSYDYGNEFDFLVQKLFFKRYTLGFKYSDYDADSNRLNIARNPLQSADKTIYWFFAQLKF